MDKYESWVLDAVEMRTKSLVIVTLLLFGTFSLALTVFPENAAANTLFVGGAGPGNYTTIRSAVWNATAGNTIFVFSGTYVEQIYIDTSLTLVGEDRDTTIIDVVAYDSVIFVDADWVSISGFTIIGKVDPEKPGEFINGIEMEDHKNCTFTNIFFETKGSGVQLISSTGNTIINNTFYRNSFGILLSLSYDSVIAGNNFTSNEANAIHLAVSRDNVIALNNFSSNEEDDIHLFSSSYNTIYHNNLNSTGESWDVGLNYWDNGYPSGGNYWKDYTGLDEKSGPDQNQPGNDGIGDTAVDVLGGSNKDRYPLMNATTAPSPPSAPRYLFGTAGDGQVSLSWDLPLFDGFSPITNYSIYRSTTSGQEVFLAEVGNVLNYTDQNLMNGQTYYYQITATNAVGESRRSNEVNRTPFTRPGPPSNLTAEAGIEQVTLNWSEPLDDGGRSIDSYVIYRKNATGGETMLRNVGNVLTFTDTGLIAGHTYFYKVAAVTIAGWGEYSNEANATPLAPPNLPPSCGITYPLSGDTVEGITTITGIASDLDGTVQEVEIRINESAWMPATGTTLWSYEWNTTELPDDSYTISARSYDGENYSEIVSLTVTVHNAPPLPGEEPEQDWLWLIIIVIIIVVFVSLVILLRNRKMKKKKEQLPEESQNEEQE